jgi:hypothetical protein
MYTQTNGLVAHCELPSASFVANCRMGAADAEALIASKRGHVAWLRAI